MNPKRDSVRHTVLVALAVCVVCALAVSLAAVALRPLQEANKRRERQKNILIAAGLYDEILGKVVIDGQPRELAVAELFRKPDKPGSRPWVEAKLIDLETGKEISAADRSRLERKFGSVQRYDPRRALSDPSGQWNKKIDPEKDVARLKRRERFTFVYLVHRPDGKIDQIVLPIRGYGLWSTLWGFLSLDADLNTIRGITFYEHGETPGLGGEVDNPDWKAKWKGKKAFDEGDVVIRVIKGTVRDNSPEAVHQVDGLSGATLTSKGVTHMLEYWLGEDGFGPFLNRLRKEHFTGKNRSADSSEKKTEQP